MRIAHISKVNNPKLAKKLFLKLGLKGNDYSMFEYAKLLKSDQNIEAVQILEKLYKKWK